MGVTILAVILAQVIAPACWGEYFPWSAPALYAGMAGSEYTHLGMMSYVIVIGVSFMGLSGTLVWWEWADQAH